MKLMGIIGIILIVIGLIGLIYGGITYTSNKDVLKMGDLHVEVQQQNRIPITPIAGAAALVVGIWLVFVDRRRGRGGSAV